MQAIIALAGDFAFYKHENFFISKKFSALSYHQFLFYKLSTAKSIFKRLYASGVKMRFKKYIPFTAPAIFS
jgi:hypothetical protein